MHVSEHFKQAGDVVSIGTVLATIAGWLPAVAALLTIVWTVIRIWETKTVQGWRRAFSSGKYDPDKTMPPRSGWPGDER